MKMQTEAAWRGLLVLGLCGALGACGGADGEDGEGSDGALAAGAAAADGGGVGEGGGGVSLSRRIESAGVAVTVPAAWEMREPSRGMRDAEFVVAAPEGVDAEAAVGTVFTGIGGGVEENLDRWAAQLGSPAERDVTIDRLTVDGRLVGILKGRGTYDPGRMMGSTGPRPDYMMLGLIAETDSDKPIVVKVTGPREVLEPQVRVFERMVESIESVGG